MHIPHDPKVMAKSLRQALAERHVDISHSDSLGVRCASVRLA